MQPADDRGGDGVGAEALGDREDLDGPGGCSVGDALAQCGQPGRDESRVNGWRPVFDVQRKNDGTSKSSSSAANGSAESENNSLIDDGVFG